jgi:hypothetical protein
MSKKDKDKDKGKRCPCENGTGIKGGKCPKKKGDACKTCDKGYTLVNQTCVSDETLAQNKNKGKRCPCENGTGIKGGKCPKKKGDACETCDEGYTLVNRKCVSEETLAQKKSFETLTGFLGLVVSLYAIHLSYEWNNGFTWSGFLCSFFFSIPYIIAYMVSDHTPTTTTTTTPTTPTTTTTTTPTTPTTLQGSGYYKKKKNIRRKK